ncbi:MAG: hypothetical protein ACKO2G_02155 [Verrucomicrobiales bacterium]
MKSRIQSDSNSVARGGEYSWLNELEHSSGIRGLVLRPWPEVPGSEKFYSEAFPYEVNVIFNSGVIRVVCRDASGNVQDERWSSLRELPFAEDEITSLEEWKDRARQATGGQRLGDHLRSPKAQE